MSKTAEQELQELLARAYKLLEEAGMIADENGLEPHFCDMKWRHHIGWVKLDDESDLQIESEWNFSGCVI